MSAPRPAARKRKASALESPVSSKAARRSAPALPSGDEASDSDGSEDDQGPPQTAQYQAESDVEDPGASDDESESANEEDGLVRPSLLWFC